MTDRTNEAQPAAVSDGAKQAGEIWQRWSWVERTVWTERMLTALEAGVKGGKWFSLMDKVTDPKTLCHLRLPRPQTGQRFEVHEPGG